VKSRILEAETHKLIGTKFCMPGAVHDEIAHPNSGG